MLQIGPHVRPRSSIPVNTGVRNINHLVSADNQYYSLDAKYILAIGDTVEFTFLAPSEVVGVSTYFFDGDDSFDRAFLGMLVDGNFTESGASSTMLLDGASVASNSVYPVDGKIHTVILTSDGTRDIGFIGCRYSLSGEYSGLFLGFKISNSSGVVKLHYKFDETGIGTIIRDYSGNGLTATAVNIDNDDKEIFYHHGELTPQEWQNADNSTSYQIV